MKKRKLRQVRKIRTYLDSKGIEISGATAEKAILKNQFIQPKAALKYSKAKLLPGKLEEVLKKLDKMVKNTTF
ncbi:MAG: hypothetical protein OEZ22_01500 [Spirochaetia bacterium]|nr:hypothetical protein [Spirochaetia bacterium]